MRTVFLGLLFASVPAIAGYGGRAFVFEEEDSLCVRVDLSAATALAGFRGVRSAYDGNYRCEFNGEGRATACFFRFGLDGRAHPVGYAPCPPSVPSVVDGVAGVTLERGLAKVRIGSWAGLWLAKQWFPKEAAERATPLANADVDCRGSRVGKLRQRMYSCYFGFTHEGKNTLTGP